MSLFSDSQVNEILPTHPFTGAKNAKRSQIHQILINGVSTNIVITSFSNLVDIMISQTNGVGAIVKASHVNGTWIAGSQSTFSVDSLLSGRDTTIASLIARRLISEPILQDREILLSCCLQSKPKDSSQPRRQLDEFDDVVIGEYETKTAKELITMLLGCF